MQVLGADLPGAQELEPLREQRLELLDRPAFEKHVPVRPWRLHVLGLRAITVHPDRLASTARTLPYRRNLGVGGEGELKVVGMWAVVRDDLARCRCDLAIVLVARRAEPGAS